MSSKTTVKPADPSPEERALQAKQLELATFQLEELRKQSDLQAQFAGDIGPLLEQQAANRSNGLGLADDSNTLGLKDGRTHLRLAA